jgi:hypothetical protein
MMKHVRLLVATILLLLGGGLAWLHYGSRETPAGQPPLTYLDQASLDTLKADFNRAAGGTRMIVLLSPT